MDNSGNQITVHIRFYGYLADYAGVRTLDMGVAVHTTAAELLHAVSARFPGVFDQAPVNLQNRHGVVKVFRNSDMISIENESQMVEAGDELRFFPAISGG